MEVDIQIDRNFMFVHGEAAAAQLDAETDDDVLEMPRVLDLRELVEDEILLAMPLVPRHDVCPEPLSAPVDAEADIPRWRRPSLEAARRSRPPSDIVREPIRFADAPHKEADRRVVGYRLVRVGDSPDDLRSAELGRLDRGDEVEVLDTAGDWAHVRSADGLDGWVPSITILTRISTPEAPATDPGAGSGPGGGPLRRLLGRQSGR